MIKMQPIFPVSGLVLIFFILTGCAVVGKPLDPPRIALANIQVQELTGFETVFQVQLRVFNTNDVNLKVKGIEAELEVNGQSFATGVSNTPVEIPAFGTELVAVTVYSSVISMVKSVVGIGKSEELKYRLRGKVRASGDNMLPATLPFESEGQVTLNPSKDSEK